MKQLIAIPSFLLATLLLWSSSNIGLVHGIPRPSALFVFGDSYSDTGNHNESEPSWNPPYGMSWPGKPAGRFSDGKILTDFLASFLNLQSPVPFRELIRSNPSSFSPGVNFAFGGSGVFDTFGTEYTNLSTQVAEFQELMHEVGLNQSVIGSSLVLLSYAGNDYIKYVTDHGASLAILSFVPQVTSEIASKLRSLYQSGFRSFVVTNMQPAGCLPSSTIANNFTACNNTRNLLSSTHNEDLVRSLDSIQKLPGAQVVVLDQFSTFNTVLSNPAQYGISETFEPCCLGLGNNTCGKVDAKGQMLYKLCEKPEAAFFWDNSHPTQTGWRVITEHYKTQLKIDTEPAAAGTILTLRSWVTFLTAAALSVVL